jgi:hypothetical protein
MQLPRFEHAGFEPLVDQSPYHSIFDSSGQTLAQLSAIDAREGNSHTLPITKIFLQASPSLAHITPLKVTASQYTGGLVGKVVHTCS